MSLAASAMRIHVIGLGVTDRAELSSAAGHALADAQVILGSERQLRVIHGVKPLSSEQECRPLPAFSNLKKQLQELQEDGIRSLAVLASGDPLYYGIGRWLGQIFRADQLNFYPAVSSIQAVCHRLHLSLQEVEVVSLHGRPLRTLNRHLRRNQTFIILTDADSQPRDLAIMCQEAGLQDSTFWVCEQLGYPQEQVRKFTLAELLADDSPFHALQVVVISTRGQGGLLPEFPGIVDDNFTTGSDDGGMITKREVRLAIISMLQVAADETVWDIGAGCGSVAVELARWQPGATIYAIEQAEQRIEYLAANRDKFGVAANLHVIFGRAPAALENLPPADKVFVGGSDGELPELLDRVWALLPAGGILLTSAVTEPTRQQLLTFYQQRSAADDAVVDTLQIAVSRGGLLAGQLVYRPNFPVTLFSFTRRESSQ